MNEPESVAPNYQKFFDDHQSITIQEKKVESFSISSLRKSGSIAQGSLLLIEDESPTHKWLLLRLQELQLNTNIARRVLKDMKIDENTPKEDLLQEAVNQVLEFEIRHREKFLDESFLNEEPANRFSAIGKTLRKTSSIRVQEIIRRSDSDPTKRSNEAKQINNEVRLSFEKKNSLNKSNSENEINRNSIKPQSEETMECPVCLSSCSKSLAKDFCGEAQHFFCSDCVTSYIEENLRLFSQGRPVRCMESKCLKTISEERLLAFYNSESREKILRYKEIYGLNKDERVRWCTRPGCEKFVRRQASEAMLTCECGQKICFQCRSSWHDGLSCQDVIDKELALYKKSLQMKYCPNCNSGIEKNEGCNHMVCANCLYEFCWLCEKKYTGMSHYSWWNIRGCPGLLMAPRRDINCGSILRGCLVESLFYFCLLIFALVTLALLPVFLFICACLLPLYLYVYTGRQNCNGESFLIGTLLLLLGIVLSHITVLIWLIILI